MPTSKKTSKTAKTSEKDLIKKSASEGTSLAAEKKTKAKRAAPARKVEAQVILDSEQDAENLDTKNSTELTSVPHFEPESETELSISSADLKAASSRSLTTTDPVTQYMNEVRKYPLLTREQEAELAKHYFETKDPIAAQRLVTSNLRFVVKIAAEYSKFGARLIDLIQEGNMGLMHAVREFNPMKGARLITYAVWWIRGYIQEYLMKQYSLVKIGTTHNQKKLFYQLQREKESLDALGENPDIEAIAERLGIPADEVLSMSQRLKGRDLSLSQPLDDDSKTSMLDFQKVESMDLDDRLAHEEEIQILREKIDEIRPLLNEREKILLEERLLNDEPLTLQEIGEKYGITREAVRQAEVRLMNKIREKMNPVSK
jgi:RNA polymerase sigma-32 factor